MTGEGSRQVIPPQPRSGEMDAGGGVGKPGTMEANMRSISGVLFSPTIMYQMMKSLGVRGGGGEGGEGVGMMGL